MNRNQAKQLGGDTWKYWLEGYNYVISGYSNSKYLTQEDIKYLLTEDLIDATEPRPGMWGHPRARFYGRAAAWRRLLYKRQ